MYSWIYIFILMFFTSSIFALDNNQEHMPLELSHKDYHQLLKQYKQKQTMLGKSLYIEDESKKAIDGGEKLSNWLALLNSRRPENDKIYLTSPDTRYGIPIDQPNIYGPKQIKIRYDELLASLPDVMRGIVYGDEEITDSLPLPKDDFIKYGRQIDRLYQTAVRWEVIIKPNIDKYRDRRHLDVRGFYYLNKIEDLDQILKDYLNLDSQTQAKLKNYLTMICINNDLLQTDCESQFEEAISGENKLVYFKNNYWQMAKDNWDNFFKIKKPRTDVTWQDNQMSMPFLSPGNVDIQQWLKDNVEDEFKFEDWHFNVDFVPNAESYIEFEPNTTPHVTEGNIIVMDKNTDIEEYEVKWILRHEYGHILRLPDCYVEFYDDSIQSAVNYQLDVSDLMCSRAGNMNKRIYEELKRVYQLH